MSSQAAAIASGKTAVNAAGSVFVGRHPIFDRDKRVYGYELLFRSGRSNAYDGVDADQDTLDVITNSFYVIGFDDLTDSKRGFINFTENLLAKDVPALLPKDRVTIEILESVLANSQMVDACATLKDMGYELALDDVTLDCKQRAFWDAVDIAKVDFPGVPPAKRKAFCQELSGEGLIVLAEKVETIGDFEQALDAGCDYFQGYFFSRPEVKSGTRMEGNRFAHMRLLQAVNESSLSYDQLEEVIKQDTAMTYNLLRLANSAWFGFRVKIESVRHALVLLGQAEIRRWATLVTLKTMGNDKPPELTICSMIRARTAEQLAEKLGMPGRRNELFLLGMLSLIDAMADQPMAEIMAKLPISDDIKDALNGKEGLFRQVLDLTASYERADWSSFGRSAQALAIAPADLTQVIAESIRWSQKAFSFM
jgi:c-di-GMP-related signal transduction protein